MTRTPGTMSRRPWLLACGLTVFLLGFEFAALHTPYGAYFAGTFEDVRYRASHANVIADALVAPAVNRAFDGVLYRERKQTTDPAPSRMAVFWYV